MMSPIDWALRPIRKYAVFSGRAPRAEYWWFYLATLIGGFIADGVDAAVGTEVVSLIVSLALLIPWVAVSVRRLHDIDRSGWWMMILLLPFLALVVAFALDPATSSETFAGMPGAVVAGLIGVLIAGITLLIFMVTAGTEGPNEYGPDPYGPDQLEEVFA